MNSILRKSLGLVLVLFIMILGLSNAKKLNAAEESVDLSIVDSNMTTETDERLEWTLSSVTITANKNSGTKLTNYYPGTPNKTYSSTRMYNNNSIVITPNSGYTILSVVFTCTTSSYADTFNGSSWTNATKSQSSTIVTVTPTNGQSAFSTTFTGTVGFTEITVNYTSGAGNVALTSISLTDVSLNPGQTGRTTITYNPASATNKGVSYQISDTNVASVENDGTITAKAAGVATLTVTPHDTNASARTCTITVTDYPAPAIETGKQYIIKATVQSGSYQLSGVSDNLGTGVTFTDYPDEDVFPLTAEAGYYTNTIAFKNGDDYLSLSVADNKLQSSQQKNANSSWLVTSDENGITIKNVAYQDRTLQFNYNKGSVRFACYSSSMTAISLYELGVESANITAAKQTVYLNETLNFSLLTNVEEPYTTTWSSTNESAATIDSNGVLHPVGIGKTTIKATVNTLDSNEIEITVYPNPANPITIAQANAIANVVGEERTTESFTIVGTFTFIDETHFSLSNEGTINVYKYGGHGYNDEDNNAKMSVSGKITKFDNTTPQLYNPTTTKLFTVTIVKNNGESNIVLEDVVENTKIDEPVTPTKDGFEFLGWKCGLNDWNFATDVVTANISIVAQWQEQQANAYDDFKLLTPRSSLKLDYTSQIGNVLFSNSFVKTAKDDKTLPSEWEGTVGGSYGSPFYQSFKKNGEYIVLKDSYDFPYSFNVTFTYYLNNLGNSDNESSKIKFVGLDSTDHEVCSVLSGELNVNPTGSANTRTISVKLNGTGIKKIKIVFVKDGGGNIAFSTVTVNNITAFTLNKEENKNLVSMRFATLLSATLVQRLAESGTTVTYGMVYGYASSFGGLTADEICEMISVGGSSEGDTSALVAQGIKFRAMSLTGVNSSGTEEVLNNPDYYQFGISINKFSDERLDDNIKTFAYVCIDGNYYATNERVFSIYSLAAQYVNAGDTSSYTEHLGVLKMLADNLN